MGAAVNCSPDKCACDTSGKNNDIVNRPTGNSPGYSAEEAGLETLPFTESGVDSSTTVQYSEAEAEEKKQAVTVGGEGKGEKGINETSGKEAAKSSSAVEKQQSASAEETVNYPDGTTYKGQLRDSVRSGHGMYKTDRQQYDGEWLNDRQNGHGRHVWTDGRAYDGEFKDGKFSGKGHMEWPTPHGPMLFDGQYAHDEKHGEGKFCWPDGRIHIGHWVCGRRHGKATFVNASGVHRQGEWENDKLLKWLDDDADGIA